MRSVPVLCLLALAVFVGGLCAQSAPPADKRKDGPPPERTSFSTTVAEVGLTAEDSVLVAEVTARKQVMEFLNQHRPALTWRRAPDELDRFIDKDSVQTEEIVEPKLRELGFRYRTTLRVEVKPRDFREILEADYQHELEDRHWLVAKVLGGLVALFGTIAVYFRLEEWTKGYYTAWLRIGAATVLSAVLGGLLMLP